MHYCLRALFFACYIICVHYFLCRIKSVCFIVRMPYYACVLCSYVMSAPLLLLLYGFIYGFAPVPVFAFFRMCLFMCLNWIPSCIPYMQNFDVFSPLFSSHDKSIVIVFIPRYFAKFLLFLGICCFIIPCCFASDFFLYFFIFCDFFYS